MTALEHQSLLLRQIAALRRRGMDHHRALALAADGIPVGELRATALRAARGLAAGGVATADDPLEALLSSSTCGVEQLELEAAAVEARLWALSSLRSSRLYFSLATAGPVLLACFLAWVTGPLITEVPFSDGIVVGIGLVLRWGGVPLAVAALVLVQRLHRGVAPGYRQASQAAALLELAVGDSDTHGPPLDLNAERYLTARRAAVGGSAAARELAAELCAESKRTQALFAQLAPLLGAVALGPILIAGFFVLVAPIWAMFQGLGTY